MAEFSSLLLRNEMRGMPLIGEFFSFHNFPLLFYLNVDIVRGLCVFNTSDTIKNKAHCESISYSLVCLRSLLIP